MTGKKRLPTIGALITHIDEDCGSHIPEVQGAVAEVTDVDADSGFICTTIVGIAPQWQASVSNWDNGLIGEGMNGDLHCFELKPVRLTKKERGDIVNLLDSL